MRKRITFKTIYLRPSPSGVTPHCLVHLGGASSAHVVPGGMEYMATAQIGVWASLACVPVLHITPMRPAIVVVAEVLAVCGGISLGHLELLLSKLLLLPELLPELLLIVLLAPESELLLSSKLLLLPAVVVPRAAVAASSTTAPRSTSIVPLLHELLLLEGLLLERLLLLERHGWWCLIDRRHSGRCCRALLICICRHGQPLYLVLELLDGGGDAVEKLRIGGREVLECVGIVLVHVGERGEAVGVGLIGSCGVLRSGGAFNIVPVAVLGGLLARFQPEVVLLSHEVAQVGECAFGGVLAPPLGVLKIHNAAVVDDGLGNVHQVMFLKRLIAQECHDCPILNLGDDLGPIVDHGVPRCLHRGVVPLDICRSAVAVFLPKTVEVYTECVARSASEHDGEVSFDLLVELLLGDGDQRPVHVFHFLVLAF